MYNKYQEQLINFYCKNNLMELKKICNPIIIKKRLPQMYYDDLYDNAMQVLEESIVSYDGNKSNFKTYLIGNIKRSFYDWTRDNMRGKRCNVQLDKNGNIMKDENGYAIVIQNISFDEPCDDGIDLSEKMMSDFRVENHIDDFGEDEFWHEETKEFLANLSPLQRRIAYMISEGYTPEEICKQLHISHSHYNNSLKRIKADEKTQPLKALV